MIRLDHGYAITVDKYGYTLGIPAYTTVTDKKTGAEKVIEIMKEASYYGTLASALCGYRHRLILKKLTNFEGSLNQTIEAINKIDSDFRKSVEALERSESK